ncbi:hypothetical protein JCM5353_000656 [Sporobolomyces roseus]
MNFNSLPNETLQRIVDLCHEADEAYEKRMGAWLREATDKEKEDLNPWGGRSCSAISMVNKTLRSLSAKYIFTTLRLSKIEAPIFQYYIVQSSLAKSFTRLFFDLPDSPSYLSAFAVFSHLAGLLSNISTVSGLTTPTLYRLCGYTGLISISLNLPGGAAPSDIDFVYRQNRNLLLKLARGWTDLDVSMDAINLEILLNTNPGGVRKVKLLSSQPRRYSILQRPDTKFPAVLAKCTNLNTLTVGHKNRTDDDSEEDDDDDDEIDPIHDSVLEVPYSFAHHLRSLTLNFPHASYPTSLNELRFAALFPSLVHLSITARTPLDQPPTKIVLPSLKKLEVRAHFNVIEKVTALLHCLDVPSLSILRLVSSSYPPFFSLIPATAKPQVEALAATLALYRPTLTTLDLVTCDIHPTRAMYRLFTLLEGSIAIDYNSKPLHEQSRRLSLEHSRNQQLGRMTQVSSTLPTDRFSSSALAYEDSTRVLKWALDYVERTKGTDKKGLWELKGVLEPVKDFMEWMEE